jgi:hypothetical protein
MSLLCAKLPREAKCARTIFARRLRGRACRAPRSSFHVRIVARRIVRHPSAIARDRVESKRGARKARPRTQGANKLQAYFPSQGNFSTCKFWPRAGPFELANDPPCASALKILTCDAIGQRLPTRGGGTQRNLGIQNLTNLFTPQGNRCAGGHKFVPIRLHLLSTGRSRNRLMGILSPPGTMTSWGFLTIEFQKELRSWLYRKGARRRRARGSGGVISI